MSDSDGGETESGPETPSPTDPRTPPPGGALPRFAGDAGGLPPGFVGSPPPKPPAGFAGGTPTPPRGFGGSGPADPDTVSVPVPPQRSATAASAKRSPARFLIPAIVIVALASGVFWFISNADDDDDSGTNQSDVAADRSEKSSAEGICAWITPRQLEDAGFAEISSQKVADIKVGGKVIPNCQFNVRPSGGIVLVGYDVQPSSNFDPRGMVDDRLGDATAIEDLGDAAAVEMVDPDDRESTGFTVAVAVGDQNLVFHGDTRAADQENTVEVMRKLVDQMRANPPAN